jgi:hypothetical protein
MFWAIFFHGKSYALILTKKVGQHFGPFFTNSSGHPGVHNPPDYTAYLLKYIQRYEKSKEKQYEIKTHVCMYICMYNDMYIGM